MIKVFEIILCMYLKTISPDVPRFTFVCSIYRRSLAFSRVSKPHTHITHMLRQCTSIVYIPAHFEKHNGPDYMVVGFTTTYAN
jgi:hypothetical protein